MPDQSELFTDYGISIGQKINNYILNNVNFNHTEDMSKRHNEKGIGQYRYYTYNISFIFKPLVNNANLMALVSEFQNIIGDDKIIYTSYGNPYKCHLQINSYNGDNNFALINVVGNAYRVPRGSHTPPKVSTTNKITGIVMPQYPYYLSRTQPVHTSQPQIFPQQLAPIIISPQKITSIRSSLPGKSNNIFN